MKKSTLLVIIMAVVIVAVMITIGLTMGKVGYKVCPECNGAEGVVEECEICCGAGEVTPFYATWASLLAPVIAIALALITKEVYSSLFIGIIIGGLLGQNFNVVKTIDSVTNDGLISAVSGTAGIFIFLVILGVLVALVNKAGGSAAFGRWATKNIHSKIGASIATFILGVLIFIDDYFNCLTVGSVMRPVTDSQKMSRAKLAFLIDATAAPVCMIAPISSWAAAVSNYAPEGQGISLFIKAIPYNLYSLLTFVFILAITFMKLDYGPMAKKELEAAKGNLGALENASSDDEDYNEKGVVLDLLLPVIFLVICCVAGLIYNGGFFDASSANYLNFVGAFADTDATVGLPLGSIVALVFTIIYLAIRRVVSFADAMKAVPQGFIAMVPAILILTFATTLKNMTGLLGADKFVEGIMTGAAEGLANFLPAIIFLVAVGLSFATGTSWGTFGILIPIVLPIFPEGSVIQIIGMSACLAGAVCGDHCSPISDTTIMSSAGAQTNHVDHVSTQLPYALTVAGFSFVGYLLLAVEALRQWYIVVPAMSVIMIVALFIIKKIQSKKSA